jgi:hypothetical protein
LVLAQVWDFISLRLLQEDVILLLVLLVLLFLVLLLVLLLVLVLLLRLRRLLGLHQYPAQLGVLVLVVFKVR